MKNSFNDDITKIIISKIDSGNSFQPILFLSDNIEFLNEKINSIILALFEYYFVDKNNLFKIEDNSQKIKINDLREYIKKSNYKSNYLFQIFLIENISRMTLESFNASLRFFEEPGNGNIIFLTNVSEFGIPETILSRVHIINIFSNTKNPKNDLFHKLIDSFLNNKNTDLLKYFYDDKNIKKEEYITFLNVFLNYIKENLSFSFLGDSIIESLNLIVKNNVIPKYEIDKIIIKASLN